MIDCLSRRFLSVKTLNEAGGRRGRNDIAFALLLSSAFSSTLLDYCLTSAWLAMRSGNLQHRHSSLFTPRSSLLAPPLRSPQHPSKEAIVPTLHFPCSSIAPFPAGRANTIQLDPAFRKELRKTTSTLSSLSSAQGWPEAKSERTANDPGQQAVTIWSRRNGAGGSSTEAEERRERLAVFRKVYRTSK